MQKLNNDYGSTCRSRWSPNHNKKYSMQLKIIDRIRKIATNRSQQLDPGYEEAVERVESERGNVLLDRMARDIREKK